MIPKAGTPRLLTRPNAGARSPFWLMPMPDYAALGVIGAYRDDGLVVGRDFALVGYHDIPSPRS